MADARQVSVRQCRVGVVEKCPLWAELEDTMIFDLASVVEGFVNALIVIFNGLLDFLGIPVGLDPIDFVD